MYSPTVARFTARDPLPQNGEAVLFSTANSYGNNSPAFSFDPSGMLTITPIEPFPDAQPKCGANANYSWDFQLTKTSATLCGTGRRGYFVQKVEIWCDEIICPQCGECPTPPKKLGEPDLVIYESWEVDAGSKVPKIREGKNPTVAVADTFNFIGTDRKNTCGYQVVKGEVRFFCRKDTG